MTKRLIPALVASTLFIGGIAHADHAWGPYHWGRTANPFTVKLGDNVTTSWDSYLKSTAADWSASPVLEVWVVSSGKNPKTCRPTAGRGEVCDAKYGYNGWLGIAQIWVSGEHITQGVVKVNDTYFSSTTYNTSEWKNLVMCQEVGHIFGLGHQDEDMNNANLGTCMDYTNDPASNQHPNQHDYDMLDSIYGHLDAITTLQQSTAASMQPEIGTDDPRAWGREVRRSEDGHASLYVREFASGRKVFTHVYWADDANSRFVRDSE